MAIEEAESKILEYLKKEKHTNTFRLATELNIDRNKILSIIKGLENKEAVEFKSGIVNFLKFPRKEKKIVEVKKVPKPKKKIKTRKIDVLKNIQAENKKLKEKLSELEASTKRRHYYTKTKKFREQAKLIERLENRIKVLQEKAKVTPKVITRKIKVPPKIVTRTIVKKIKVPVKLKEKKEAKPKKFKLPKFDLNWIKNIQQLEKPEFIEQKISSKKINFSELNKNIQQIHVPEIFKKGG